MTLVAAALSSALGQVIALVDQPDAPVTDDNKVVAGWVAAVVFVVLVLATAVICRSLVTRLRNVDRAAEEGLYDPSDPKPERPARGLGARPR